MLRFVLLVFAAFAGPSEDLALASSKAASEEVRMGAFERLVALGATDMNVVSKISQADDGDVDQGSGVGGDPLRINRGVL